MILVPSDAGLLIPEVLVENTQLTPDVQRQVRMARPMALTASWLDELHRLVLRVKVMPPLPLSSTRLAPYFMSSYRMLVWAYGTVRLVELVPVAPP